LMAAICKYIIFTDFALLKYTMLSSPYPAITINQYAHGISNPEPEPTHPMRHQALVMAGQDLQHTAPSHEVSQPVMAADPFSAPALDVHIAHNPDAAHTASGNVLTLPAPQVPPPTLGPLPLEETRVLKAAEAARKRQEKYDQRVLQLTTILAQNTAAGTAISNRPMLLKHYFPGPVRHFLAHIIQEVRVGFPRIDVGRTHILCTLPKLETAFRSLEHPRFRCPCCSNDMARPDGIQQHLDKSCKFNGFDQQRVEEWKKVAVDDTSKLEYWRLEILSSLGFTTVHKKAVGNS